MEQSETLQGPAKVKVMVEEAKKIDSESSFMEPGTKKKRGPKGPWKHKEETKTGPSISAQTEKTASPEETVETLKQVIKPIWEVIDHAAVGWAGDNRAALGRERLELVTHTSAVCVNQYLPDALGKHAPLILLSVTVLTWSVSVFAIRKENILKMKEAEKAKKESHANGTLAS